MEALIAKLPELIFALITAVVLPLLAYWTKSYINSKVSNEKAKGIFLRLDDAVLAAVAAVAQSTTDALKEGAKDGKLTTEDAKAAKKAALDKAKSYLGAPGLKILSEVIGCESTNTTALDTFIGDKIEGAVRADKLASASADSVAKALEQAGG